MPPADTFQARAPRARVVSLLRHALACASLLVALAGCGAKTDVVLPNEESAPLGAYGLTMSVDRIELRCRTSSLRVDAHVRVAADGALRERDAGFAIGGPLTAAEGEIFLASPDAGIEGVVVGTFDVVPFTLTEDAPEADVQVVSGSYRDSPGLSLCDLCNQRVGLRVRFDDHHDYGAHAVQSEVLHCSH